MVWGCGLLWTQKEEIVASVAKFPVCLSVHIPIGYRVCLSVCHFWSSSSLEPRASILKRALGQLCFCMVGLCSSCVCLVLVFVLSSARSHFRCQQNR